MILLRRRFAIALAFSLTIGSFCWASAPVDLDRETELTSRLEAFLTHRIQRVVNSSGVRGDDFSASAIVKVVKIAPPHAEEDPSAKKASDPEKAKKDAQKESEKKNENPDFLTFNDNSFMDADHLIAEVEREESSVRPTSLNLDKKPEPEKKDDDSYYGIDHVFIQAALSEKLDAATLTAVEKTLHNSFDPLFGNKVTIEVKPYTAVQPTWYETLFKWLKSFQWLTMELLFLTLATVLFFANKLIPSWQAKQATKTAHDEKQKLEQSIEASDSEPKDEEIEDEKGDVPADPPVLEDLSVVATGPTPGDVLGLEKDLVNFAEKHPKKATDAISEWAKSQEPVAKIGFYIELLSRSGVELGQVKLRTDLIRELRQWRKKHEEYTLSDRFKVLKEIYWDLIASEHLSKETTPGPFEFLNFVEDNVLYEAVSGTDVKTKAEIISSIGDKRASAILNRLSPAERGPLISEILASPKSSDEAIQKRAQELFSRIEVIGKSRIVDVKPGGEVLTSILRSLDFEAAFTACASLLNEDMNSLKSVMATFFNVGLLPKAKPEFILSVFEDLSSDDRECALGQFSSEFVKDVVEMLPPIQKRMLENADFTKVSRTKGIAALQKANSSILSRIAENKLSLDEIFQLGEAGTTTGAGVYEAQAA